jgi:hypothetical protein
MLKEKREPLTAEFFCFAEEFRCLLQEGFKDSLLRSISFNSSSLTAAQQLLKSSPGTGAITPVPGTSHESAGICERYLARNTRVAATFA